ncbi:ankyrin repeat domain-containing protein SOWAHA isoform X2 [Sphaeramia orbicularis]|uniref:ankyrin repeat domain-containing protein SOWAHA isoform X2 n=1 Tax=Sphaeramia orbicularis TaxID=375764 RepID=UPI00117F5F34|nr:ankyrin repeat domain-containing protein SOWAHA-like isoform X2 [Sphaeramia orbicularis]
MMADTAQELQRSPTGLAQADQDPPKPQILNIKVQDQTPEHLKQDQDQQRFQACADETQSTNSDVRRDQTARQLGLPQNQLEELNQSQTHANENQDGTFPQEETHQQHRHQQSVSSDQQQQRGHIQGVDVQRDLRQDQTRAVDQGGGRAKLLVHRTDSHLGQDPKTAAANQEEAGESGGSVPALVITQAEELRSSPLTKPNRPAVTPKEPVQPQKPQRPTDLVIPAAVMVPTEPCLSFSSEGGDMTCSDLLSWRSDSISLGSDPTVSRRSDGSQEDDTTSVAASSVMSLFHRVQLDPLEKDWLRSSALGNLAAQRQLLMQEPSLVLKKDFITTALHWAAKQGRQEAVDMMLRSGADVNVRSQHGGYTALHLASIHGHQHIILSLINIYNAKTNIRDYHGKTAVHYWSGSTDIFNKVDSQTDGVFSQRRRTQRYTLPSLLLSRSRSYGQINLEFTLAQSASSDLLELQL